VIVLKVDVKVRVSRNRSAQGFYEAVRGLPIVKGTVVIVVLITTIEVSV